MTDVGAPDTVKPPDGGDRLLDILGASDDPAEKPHPEWRRRLHHFCEAWIFALVIAFAIRHFCLELYRIPSASMEPMLLGDPGFGKGDFVVVDKFTTRFRAPQRWDVTVFQYPVPEVDSSLGGRARPAESAQGDRLDHPLWRPLQGSSFVKRMCVMPGERFYIAGGDIFVADATGVWSIARKPVDVQERLWMPILQAGAQPGYRPWQAERGASISDQGPADGLQLNLGNGSVNLTQPLRNLYLKDGSVAVKRAADSDKSWMRIDDLSMLRPQFTWPATQQVGTIWELDQWDMKRLTSTDQDDPSRGTGINKLMTEWVGDQRISFRVERLSGSPRLSLINQAFGVAQPVRSIELIISDAGWKIQGSGLAQGLAIEGGSSLVGRQVTFAHVDGHVVLTRDGYELVREGVDWIDPNVARPQFVWSGPGEITVSALGIACDLHYTQKGFLVPPDDPDDTLRKLRKNSAETEVIDTSYAASIRLPRTIRAELLRKPAADLTRAEAIAAYGTSAANPATAPADAYLMLGDNSPHSFDGREWGWVPADNLRGRAWLVVFPPQRWRVVR